MNILGPYPSPTSQSPPSNVVWVEQLADELNGQVFEPLPPSPTPLLPQNWDDCLIEHTLPGVNVWGLIANQPQRALTTPTPSASPHGFEDLSSITISSTSSTPSLPEDMIVAEPRRFIDERLMQRSMDLINTDGFDILIYETEDGDFFEITDDNDEPDEPMQQL